MRGILLMSICLGSSLLAYGQARNGRILGQVRDERLRPIAGARIDVSLVPTAAGAKIKPYLTAALTRRDGTFQIDVPPGMFSVCAALPKSDLLDSCLWDVPLRPNVQAGGTVHLEPVMLRQAYPLTIRIEDSGAVLASSKGTIGKRQILVGVSLPNGGYLPAPLRTKTQNLRIHQVLIPRDTPVSLSVFAKGVRLNNEAGAALDTNKTLRVEVNLAGERSKRQFVYTVAGLSP